MTNSFLILSSGVRKLANLARLKLCGIKDGIFGAHWLSADCTKLEVKHTQTYKLSRTWKVGLRAFTELLDTFRNSSAKLHFTGTERDGF